MLATPETKEDEQVRDVFAHFGLVAYHAQCFEKSLAVTLTLHGIATGSTLTLRDLDVTELAIYKSPLGPLLKRIKEAVTIEEDSEGIEEIFAAARKRRNFLMHNFFWEMAYDFATEEGRERILAELDSIFGVITRAECLATAIGESLGQALGISAEMTQQEMAKSLG